MEENRLQKQTGHQNNETEESKRKKKTDEIYKKIMAEYKDVIKRLE